MAISEKRFASELIDAEGAVHKFDDLHCLLEFRRRNNSRVTAGYVMDFERQVWINAAEAYFVRSKDLRTPMGGGIVALGDRGAAERHARSYGTTVASFGQLTRN
jgi:copper chaperone NosL